MSLLAWYPFNGNYNNNGCGEADLTVVSTLAYTDTGLIGKALSTGAFKWSAAQTKNILNNKALTIAFWVYPHTNTSGGILFGNDGMSSGSGRRYSIFLYPTVNDLHLSWQNDITSTDTIIESVVSGVFPSNKWTHCCIAYDNPSIKIYINGELKTTWKATYNASSFEFETQVINYASNRYINDFRVYDHCLSAREVKELAKGLILHYPLSNPYTEATTNLYKKWSETCHNATTGKYNYGTSTDIYYTEDSDNTIRVYMGTDGQKCWPFVFFGNLTPALNSKKTLSFDYYPSIADSVNFYTYDTSGTISYNVDGVTGTDGTMKVVPGKWNHIELTITNTGSTTYGWGYMKIGSADHISNKSYYWLFKNIQIEEKDHATGYEGIGLSRSAETTEYDVSGYANNATYAGTINMVSGAPRYNFALKNITSTDIANDITSTGAAYIKGTMNNTITNPDNITISWWGNMIDWSRRNSGILSFSLNANDSTDHDSALMNQYDGNFRFNNINKALANIPAGTLIENNKWHHYAFVYNGSKVISYRDGKVISSAALTGKLGSFKYVYLGLSAAGGAFRKTTGCWSDFRIYATALSEKDIYELCSTPVAITNNGAIMTQAEFIER